MRREKGAGRVRAGGKQEGAVTVAEWVTCAEKERGPDRGATGRPGQNARGKAFNFQRLSGLDAPRGPASSLRGYLGLKRCVSGSVGG